MSVFSFVSLKGKLEEVKDPAGKRLVRQQFVEMVARKKLSPTLLTALGQRPDDRPDMLVTEERSLVWKLVGVTDICLETGWGNGYRCPEKRVNIHPFSPGFWQQAPIYELHRPMRQYAYNGPGDWCPCGYPAAGPAAQPVFC
jgi:hypothetical protein